MGIRAHAKALAWDENDPHKVTQWAANLWQLQFIVASETNELTQAQEQEEELVDEIPSRKRSTKLHNSEAIQAARYKFSINSDDDD